MRVYDYDVSGSRHCREGVAADDRGDGFLRDTFWGSGYGDRHVLRGEEAQSARLRFDTDEFEEIVGRRGAPSAWTDRAPGDRQTLTSQHGLEVRWFIRKGSQPDRATRLENARQKVADALSAVRLAESSLRYAEGSLAAIEHEVTP